MEAKRSGCLGRLFSTLVAAVNAASPRADFPYRVRSRFITANEAAIYEMLDGANSQRVVFANVRLSDLIDVSVGRSARSAYQAALNRILQRQVDFVICDRATFRPLLAIELDDATHDRPRRTKSDTFENEALKSAGLPLLRLRGRYEPAQLLEQVERSLIASAPTNQH